MIRRIRSKADRRAVELVLTAKGTKLIQDAAKATEPYNREMIRMAREQELGPVQVILADAGFAIGDPTQWRLKKDMAGGGSLMDIGIYSLNASRYLTGEEPSEINAMMYNTPGHIRFKEVEENVSWLMRFPSGVIAHCAWPWA